MVTNDYGGDPAHGHGEHALRPGTGRAPSALRTTSPTVTGRPVTDSGTGTVARTKARRS